MLIIVYFLGNNSIRYFNPSGLYGNITIEDLQTDNYSASTRNRLIAEAFYLTGDIEKYGSGFIRIRKSIVDYPTMKFTYRDSGGGFTSEFSYTMQKNTLKVEQTNNEKNPSENSANKETTEKTTEKILSAIKNNPYITTNELAVICNLTPDGIYWNMKKLKTAGLLTRVGPAKGGYWKVNQ